MDTVMLANGVVVPIVSIKATSVEINGTYVNGIELVTSGVSLSDVKLHFSVSSNLSSFTYVSEDKATTKAYSGYEKLKSIAIDASSSEKSDEEYIVVLAQTTDVKELISAWKIALEKQTSDIANIKTTINENIDDLTTDIASVKTSVESNIDAVKSHDEIIKKINTSIEELTTKDSTPATLESAKLAKINESKVDLATYLSEHPILSKCHDENGAYYSVTQEKQQYLTSMISIATLAAQQKIEYQCSWNSVGKPCTYDWTLEQLEKLAFEIAEYVRPLVSQQQQIETTINNMTTIDSVNAYTINYVA